MGAYLSGGEKPTIFMNVRVNVHVDSIRKCDY